jgi:competence protein ComEA
VNGATASAGLVLATALLAHALLPERTASTEPGSLPDRGAARLLWGAPLDLNREAAESFEALAGIGPSLAAAIVASRPYCTVAELDRVPGIGPRTLERLTGRVAILAPPEACAARRH